MNGMIIGCLFYHELHRTTINRNKPEPQYEPHAMIPQLYQNDTIMNHNDLHGQFK